MRKFVNTRALALVGCMMVSPLLAKAQGYTGPTTEVPTDYQTMQTGADFGERLTIKEFPGFRTFLNPMQSLMASIIGICPYGQVMDVIMTRKKGPGDGNALTCSARMKTSILRQLLFHI